MMGLGVIAALLLTEAFGWLVWIYRTAAFHTFRYRFAYLLFSLVTIGTCVGLFVMFVSTTEINRVLVMLYLALHVAWVVERAVYYRVRPGQHRERS